MKASDWSGSFLLLNIQLSFNISTSNDYGIDFHKSMLILECGKREVQNAFRKQWKKYLSVSVYGKRKTE